MVRASWSSSPEEGLVQFSSRFSGPTSLKFGACERCMADGGNPSAAWETLKVADFEVGRDKDLADRPDKVKWYSPLEGDIWRPRAPGP